MMSMTVHQVVQLFSIKPDCKHCLHSQRHYQNSYIDVQMQQGCNDCGLFAIAFATLLARGEQLGGFFYEQKAMRKHFIESLEKQNITAFPVQKIRCHGSKARHSANLSKNTNPLCFQISKIRRNLND